MKEDGDILYAPKAEVINIVEYGMIGTIRPKADFIPFLNEIIYSMWVFLINATFG